jgi:hypothetical protein
MREPVPEFDEFGKTPWPRSNLATGDLQSALEGFAARHMLACRRRWQFYGDSDLCGFGAVLWLMEDRLGAANVWAFATEEATKGRFKYSSTGTLQPGLLLWFASVWLKDEDWHGEASALFDKLFRRKISMMSGSFQLQLAKLLRKEVGLEDVRAAYTSMRAGDRDGAERQALFYAGVRAYEDGKVEETERLWGQLPMPVDREGELEFYLLMHERKKLG